MANGTINLVNNSTALTGVGSKFLTEVTPGDFIYVEVGTVPYTLPVDKVNSDTSITLLRKFTGPTINGIAWTLIPRRAQNSVASALADQVAEAIRLSLNNENNWQKLLTENGNVTITRPDGSTYTGPSWISILNTTLQAGDFGLGGTAPRTPAVSSNSYDSIPTGLVSGFWTHAVTGGPYAYTITLMQDGGGVRNSRHLIIPASNAGRIALRWDDGNRLDYQYFYTDKNKPTAADVSALALNINSLLVDLNTLGYESSAAVYAQKLNANALLTNNYPIQQAGSLYVTPSAYGCQQMYATYSNRLFLRALNGTYTGNGPWNNWAEFYSTINTTRASDGTLKAASPIVKLFADGSFETNEESEGVTVSRVDVGQYLIEGCEALNSDAAWGGWDGGFDIPTDRNKQPLIWLDYDVNPDGSVLVKTYHRTHPDSPEFARNRIGYKNDAGDFIETVANWDPVDIPSDQFVSVRVEMPQDSIWNQRQKETAEMMDSETSNQESTTGDEVEKG
ncbi:pyocin knob domain-containing protein [Enterobacter ludwigii]|uniref:pyocin knob domain-containing protein n=1 Tax=Enterobacter ludwigii TaxID=299767 RepID=UPI0039762044